MENYLFISIVVALLFSAFFSGMEIAFVSSNKLKIELDSKQGFLPAKIYSHFLKFPSRYIGTMLVGNNIALVVYGILMAKLLEPPIREYISDTGLWVLLIQTIISTLFVLITAEFLPKALFRINPNRTLIIFSFPVIIAYVFLFPIVMIVTAISELFLKKVFKIDFDDDQVAFGKIDLDHYITEYGSAGKKEDELDHEVQIFKNALDFSNIKARECMIPRTEIVALEVNDHIDELQEKFIETGLSKILIYRDSIDNVIGYTHVQELFKKPKKIKSILIPVIIVPESMPANEVLTTFINNRKSIAVVVDEFGGTSGLLTIEDVIEEIFGEIEDEHDTEELLEKKVSENEFLFSARIEIDYINEKYKLGLPESEEYETLAGLIIDIHESIPSENEHILLFPYEFVVKKVSEKRIDLVEVNINDAE